MKTWIKRILIGLVVVVVVAVVGLAIFLLTFDPNAYKQNLAKIIEDRYQRSLTIDGEIELSLFPRIGLSLQDVALSEPNSPDVFASIESARVAVAVWPLLSNNLVVDHVAIAGFKARVIRNKDGGFNFDDLIDGPDGVAIVDDKGVVLTTAGGIGQAGLRVAGADRASGFQIDIAGLDLQQGELIVQDHVTGRAVTINELNINTGRVTFNQAFNATLSAHIEGGNPRMDARLNAQGMLTLDPAARRYAAQKLDFRLTGQLPDAQAKSLVARGNVAFNGREAALDVSALEILFQGDLAVASTPLTGVDASVVIPKLSAHPANRQLQLEKLTVRATGAMAKSPFEIAVDAPALNISPSSAEGQALTGRVRLSGTDSVDTSFSLTGISGNASELDINEAKLDASIKQGDRLIKTAFTTPLMLDMVHRSFAMSALRGDVAITDPGLPKGSLQIPVIGSLGADMSKDQATANINAVLEGGKFDLAAKVTGLNDTPRLGFNLIVDTLDLDKLAPPVAPPLPKTEDGDEGEGGQKPAPPPQGGMVDLSALVGPSATGTIKIGKLVLRSLKADDVSADVKLEAGKLDLENLNATLYQGKLSGMVSIDAAKNNAMRSKLSLADIAIEPLLNDVSSRTALSGTGTIVLDLTTAGANTYAMRTALNGTAQARLRDGAIKGINVARTLRDLKAVLRGEREAKQRAEEQAAQAAAQPTQPAEPPATQPATPPAPPAVEARPADGALQTDFTALDLDLTFKDGLGTVKALNVASPLLRITQGNPAELNLVASTLDVVALVRVVNSATGQDGEDLADLKNITIPIHFVGPLAKPLFSVQWKGIASKALEKTLENKVLDAVGGNDEKRRETVKDVSRALKGILNK